MSFDYLIQGIGLIGLLLGVSAYFCKSDQILKALISAASFIISIHFFLMGAYSGAGAAAFSGLRSALAIFKQARPFAPLFFAAYIPLGYFTIHDALDILPILSGLIATYAMFYCHGIKMRAGLFCGSSLWLVHNVLQGSIGASLLETFYLCANTYMMWRLHRDTKTKNVIVPR